MMKFAVDIAIKHLQGGKVVKIDNIYYTKETIPIYKALCSGCPLLEKSYKENAQGVPDYCYVCLLLDWENRKQPYRVRIHRLTHEEEMNMLNF